MHLGLSLSPQLALRQTQRLNLTQTQRLDLHQHLFGLRLELVGRLHDEHYTPQAKCSGCSYNLKLVEILHGFRDDPDDITTECPKCQRRFTPSLIAHGRFGTKVILSFYCSEQTLARLDANIDPATYKKTHPAIYRSVLFHFGSLRQAFASQGREYSFKESFEWAEKVEPFLGRLPDTEIARCANVPVGKIRRLRRKFDIPVFTKRRTWDEL
ncbi:hypothetical protein HOB10_03140 [Candidatus Parcubacteria bacterium]|jgi:hypothetical protein|nr:hypothetical protein [Candidatus Parcubacteria bacterium]